MKETTKRDSEAPGPDDEQAVMAEVPRFTEPAAHHTRESAASDASAWIREHRCTYDVQPLVDKNHGRAVEVGYEVNLNAELPVTGRITVEDARRVEAIRDRLREILECLISEDVDARIQRVFFKWSVRSRRGASKRLMVIRSALVFHPNYRSVELSYRERFGPMEKHLRKMGFTRA
ncbi:MAG TPA: hypothetical protein VEK15_32825 [Vicinamibacteria bacterium]|nr:hypothetical protein [Vicinamibacteria bacterium]